MTTTAPERQLHYNRYQYYDPSTGRYVAADPVGQFGVSKDPSSIVSRAALEAENFPEDHAAALASLSQASQLGGEAAIEANLYLYSGNNPIRYSDPQGTAKVDLSCGALGASVVLFCKASTSCEWSGTCEVLKLKIAVKRLCMQAQILLTAVCYSDNPTHGKRIIEMMNGIARCQRFLDEARANECCE